MSDDGKRYRQPSGDLIHTTLETGDKIVVVGAARPDPEVIACLERALAEAKTGKLRGVAVVADAGGDIYSDWFCPDQLTLVGLMEYVKGKIIAQEP